MADERTVEERLRAFRAGLEALQAVEPDDLTDAESLAVDAGIAWLEEKWGEGPECPYCKESDWGIGPPLSFATSDGADTFPFFPVTCGNCGNTVFVVIPDEEQDESEALLE